MASRQTLTLRPEGPVDELPTPGRLAGSLATTSRPLPRAQPPALGAAASLRQSASFTLRRSAAVAAVSRDAAVHAHELCRSLLRSNTILADLVTSIFWLPLLGRAGSV